LAVRHGLRVTSPLATAVHLARHLPRPFALSALDAMARAELISVGRWQIWGDDTSLEDTVGKILGVVPLSRRW
jgi:hypothetical protein